MTNKEPNKESWHLKKELSIGHIFTTVMICITAFMYIQQMDKRIIVLEQRLQTEIERSLKLEQELSRRIDENKRESREERKALTLDMKQGFKEINAKLDKMLERQK